ncbi:hypothetical protein [Hansschlegelia sp. KR7-227]|uniref:hypothetical protein n=1 Tax=Hansschlegelia sp. KR7-227 TaxID=3400914 RepID=UPI003C093181
MPDPRSPATVGGLGARTAARADFAPPAATISRGAADPIIGLIEEYRRLGTLLKDVPGDIEDDHPVTVAEHAVFQRICDDCPTPTTRGGAIEAIRLARVS